MPIKQADVNLLAYPLDIVSDKARVAQDLAYYAPRLAPEGPAMGAAIVATLYARAGQAEQAYSTFQHSYQGLRLAPFGVLEEYPGGGNPYFATGAGGSLQALLFGLGGLTIDDRGIHQRKTPLPKRWKKLEIRGVGVERATFTSP